IDRFRYRLVAGGVRSAPAEVAITVVAVNEAPQAVDDAYAVDRGRTLNVAAPGVLANDRDPDRDPLTVTLVDAPLVGTLNLAANGGFSYTPPPDYVGETTFRYAVRDPQGLAAQATVRIVVNQNLAPLPDAYAFDEGEVLFVDAPGVLANDSIIAQGPLRVVVTQQPAFGTLAVANDGSFVYRPDTTDRNGTTTFRYRLEDNAVTSPAVEVRLTINAVNDPPQTDDDRYLTDENAELIVAAPGVLDNDEDGDSATFTATLLTPPAHGTLTLRPDGSFDYVPEVNYRGVDTFTYNAVDAGGAVAAGTVTLDVTAPPTVTNDVFIVDLDTPFTTPDDSVLLINDFDSPENDPLVVIVGEGPSHGRVENLDPQTGKFTYIPDAGFSGIDTMTYRATDGRSESNVGVVTFAVGITNFPRAIPDEYETTEDQELIVPAIDGVLANDTDADTPHDALSVFLVGYDSYNYSRLDVTLNPNGSFRVRPWANFYGETFFVYQVYDGTDISNAAVVKIKVLPVNDGVEANDDRYGVLRNTVFEPNASIRANDRYDEDYPVNFEVVVQPQSGTVELDAQTGHFRYTPDRDFAGTDTFTYRLFQVDTGIGDTAVVTLRTNGPAVASPDAYTAIEDSVATVTPHPLANDHDPDGDPVRLTSASFSDLRYVTLSVADAANPQSATTLATTNHFYGTRELQYSIYDGTATTYSKLTFTVSPVPDAPVAAADAYLTQRNTTLQISDANQGVLRNDFDPDTRPYAGAAVWDAAQGADLLPITARLVSSTSHGTLTLSQVGTFAYVPDTDWSGTDTFTYRVDDATGRQSGVVTVSIRVNSPAVANDDAYVLNEDVPLVVTAAQGLLVNDTDVDGDALYAYGASSGCAPCNGRVTVRQDGGFTYTPNANFHGQDEFFYSVRDGVAEFDVGRVAITVLPVNDAPVTEPDTYRTREDEVLVAPEPQGTLRNDREVDGERLVDAESTVAPAHGSIVFGPDGAFTYTPDVNFNGRDTFRYRVFDQTGLFTEEDVEVIVTSVNDAPRALADEYATEQTTVLTVDAASGVLANDTDVDGPAPTAALTGLPQHGEVTLEADGSFVYEPDGFFAGVDQFQYQIDDGLGALATAAVSIRVNAVAPEVRVTVEDDFYRFEGPTLDTPAPGLLGNDAVTGAPALTAALVLAPERGTVEVRADGGFRYTAPPGWSGVVGFTYSASAAGVTELGHATLTVLATANEPPVALGEQFGVLEDHVLDSASSGNLLANDVDYEGAPLTLEVTTPPAHGVLDARADGAFTYTPAPDYHGADAFAYRVSDGVRQSPPVTASISVIAQNDAPVARPDRYQGPRATPVVADAAHGLLANDSDADGDALAVELVDAPVHGQVQVAVDGSFVYTPQPDYSGEDRFRYAAGDGVARGVAEVVLAIADAVNRPPTAQGETYTIDEDATLASATAGSLVANDADPDGDALSVVVATPPAHGVLDARADGAFTYTPAPDYHGADAFA
ncbi:MAG TPA: Ig-like domain-containing protein, partial [Tahibacter sp.]|nr:Ig-like domain-containing protein [Tahibacter sp.]